MSDAAAAFGNTKGIMICNRPDVVVEDAHGPAPFKAGSYLGDPIGIAPVKDKDKETPVASKKKVCPASQRHFVWLKELDAQIKCYKEEQQQCENKAAEKKARVAKWAEKQREIVKDLMDKQRQVGISVDSAALEKAFDRRDKPKWAMTEQQAQVAEAEDADADDLLDFASNLSFEEYIHDVEVRQALCVLKDRCGRIQREQQVFREQLVEQFNQVAEDDEVDDVNVDGAASVCDSLGSSASALARRRRQGDKEDWDGSAAGKEQTPRNEEQEAFVEAILHANPNIRSVHSKASLSNLVQKADAMSDTSPPNPTIVNIEQGDPTSSVSQLPYLYRSPAI